MIAHVRGHIVFAALLGFLACTALPVLGQASPNNPIFLSIPQQFPDLDARAVLMREPGRDVVILKESDATPETLRVALAVLTRMRRDHPLPPDLAQLVPITGFVFEGSLDPDERVQLEAALAELEERPLSNLGNLGMGRWLPYREH